MPGSALGSTILRMNQDGGQSGLGPITGRERIEVLDVLRGIAILGILVMNIRNFALPLAAFHDPLFAGGGAASLVTWFVGGLLFEDKMIAILSLLFGAGLVIAGDRAGQGSTILALARRHVALLLIGALHAYFVWYGDILNTYAIAGLLLLPLRRAKPRTLVVLGILVSFCSLALRIWPTLYRDHLHPWTLGRLYTPAPKPPLTEAAAYRGSWAELIAWRAWLNWHWHFRGNLGFNLWRCGGLMLIGMALARARFFVTLARRLARRLVAFGYALGMPAVLLGLHHEAAQHAALAERFGFSVLWTRMGAVGLAGSTLVALGHLGAVTLLVASGTRVRLRGLCSAVGRFALTNYLLQSALCVLVFDGWALGGWGRWTMAEQAVLVVAIWIAQTSASAWWQRRFAFGPAEALLRAVTYLHRPRLG